MLRILSPLKPKNLLPKQVPALLFSRLFNTGPHNNPPPSTSSQTESTQLDISSLDFKSVKEAIISECSRFCGGKSSNLYGLKELLLDVSRVVPGVSRRLRRVSALGPEDVVELLVGFRNECGRDGVDRGKVESLWGVFRWANDQNRSFRHCEDSCEVMASKESNGGGLCFIGNFCRSGPLVPEEFSDSGTRDLRVLFNQISGTKVSFLEQ